MTSILLVYFSDQLVPLLLASFHKKYSIQNSIDTQRMLYMQEIDQGSAKILQKPAKDAVAICCSHMKRPMAEHGSKTQQH